MLKNTAIDAATNVVESSDTWNARRLKAAATHLLVSLSRTVADFWLPICGRRLALFETTSEVEPSFRVADRISVCHSDASNQQGRADLCAEFLSGSDEGPATNAPDGARVVERFLPL